MVAPEGALLLSCGHLIGPGPYTVKYMSVAGKAHTVLSAPIAATLIHLTATSMAAMVNKACRAVAPLAA